MRFRQPPTIDSPPSSAGQLDEQAQLRILIETAMEQTQLAPTDPDLIARQLAAELGKREVTLSDVRVAVQALYQGDRHSAEAYLDYLAERGFPLLNDAPAALETAASVQQLEAQHQAISSYQPNTYGQVAVSSSDTSSNNVAFYSGNLIAELVANSAYSALVFGERRSGTSAILRALLYDQIAKAGNAILDVLDLHNGQWGGLEGIKLPDNSQIVSYLTLAAQADIDAVTHKLATVAAEVRRRQQHQRSQEFSLSANKSPPPYLFLIDGLSDIHGALPGWRADRRSKDPAFSQAASSLRVVLCHGPAVGISCVATARSHSTCLCDATALGETRLLFLGRISPGRNGGYRAIDSAVEDKELLPSPHERSRYRELLSAVKQAALPVVFTPSGIPRLAALGDFSGYLSVDLLTHYQQALEAQTT